MAEENETPQDAVSAGRAASGSGTATGQEAARRAGDEPNAASSAHENEIEGAHADYLGEGAEPVGLQAEPAVFVANGALEPGFVGSTSGPVPVASVAKSEEHAKQIEADVKKSVTDSYNSTSARQRVTDEKLARMSGAEIAAVATDRGYDLSGAAGGRGLRAMFKKAQDKDTGLEGDEVVQNPET